jgi:hypothetical protein
MGGAFQKLDIEIKEIFASADGKKVAIEAKADGVLANGEVGCGRIIQGDVEAEVSRVAVFEQLRGSLFPR